MRIDIIVILNIVFVVRWRYEKRIEVYNIDAEIFEIIHLVEYALQISAVKLSDVHLGRILAPVGNLLRVSVKICVFVGQYVICGVAVIKSVHKNLVTMNSSG